MKCDLHVHTIHSGMCTVPVFNRIYRESYNQPEHLYETLKRRGMDLVTVTDHDSIDAAESLRRHEDSNRRRRDGWLLEGPGNLIESGRKALNEARKAVPFVSLPKL